MTVPMRLDTQASWSFFNWGEQRNGNSDGFRKRRPAGHRCAEMGQCTPPAAPYLLRAITGPDSTAVTYVPAILKGQRQQLRYYSLTNLNYRNIRAVLYFGLRLCVFSPVSGTIAQFWVMYRAAMLEVFHGQQSWKRRARLQQT